MVPRGLSSLILFLALGLNPSKVFSKSDWNYDEGGPHGPSNWHGICHTGTRQSPIDIVVKHAAPVKFADLKFRQYNYLLNTNEASLQNNGHTVVLEIAHSSRGNHSLPKVNDGGLESIYVLDHIHFHAGSEHTINGRRYPLEAHLVHRDHQSPTISDALKRRDGIAVLGVFFHSSDAPNLMLNPLIEALERLDGSVGGQVQMAGEDVSPMPVTSMIPADTMRFFRYYGSLTTPLCQEAVAWTVFEDSIPISEDQLKQFRMPDSNFRPVQPLNRRFVLHNGAWATKEMPSSDASTLHPLVFSSVIFLSSFLLLL